MTPHDRRRALRLVNEDMEAVRHLHARMRRQRLVYAVGALAVGLLAVGHAYVMMRYMTR